MTIDCFTGAESFRTGATCPAGLKKTAAEVANRLNAWGRNSRWLEDAIYKKPSLLANPFHLKHHSQLRAGNWANLVVFDPEKVNNPATDNAPHHYATDIPHALVNGGPAINAGEHTGAKPEAALRHGSMIATQRNRS